MCAVRRPQPFALGSGTCSPFLAPPRLRPAACRLVLIVVDECHRVTGNAAPVAALTVSPATSRHVLRALTGLAAAGCNTSTHTHTHVLRLMPLPHRPADDVPRRTPTRPNAPQRGLCAQELRRTGLAVRVVGLSATPGKNAEAVQEVVRHLGVSRVEFRSDEDPDVSPHVHNKQVRLGGWEVGG